MGRIAVSLYVLMDIPEKKRRSSLKDGGAGKSGTRVGSGLQKQSGEQAVVTLCTL